MEQNIPVGTSDTRNFVAAPPRNSWPKVPRHPATPPHFVGDSKGQRGFRSMLSSPAARRGRAQEDLGHPHGAYKRSIRSGVTGRRGHVAKTFDERLRASPITSTRTSRLPLCLLPEAHLY